MGSEDLHNNNFTYHCVFLLSGYFDVFLVVSIVSWGSAGIVNIYLLLNLFNIRNNNNNNNVRGEYSTYLYFHHSHSLKCCFYRSLSSLLIHSEHVNCLPSIRANMKDLNPNYDKKDLNPNFFSIFLKAVVVGILLF